jgi:hypothetical protein
LNLLLTNGFVERPQGDYSKLEFRIRTNKEIYTINEKIKIQLYVGNVLDSVANVQYSSRGIYYYYSGNFVAIKNSSGKSVLPTEEGKRELYAYNKADHRIFRSLSLMVKLWKIHYFKMLYRKKLCLSAHVKIVSLGHYTGRKFVLKITFIDIPC